MGKLICRFQWGTSLSNYISVQRLICLLIVGLIGSTLPGCSEEIAVGNSSTTTTAFGPTLVIKSNVPGLSAEEVATQIAAPIEKQLTVFETLPLIEAICTEGQVEFLLHTKADCNLKQLEMLIRDRLASARETLPSMIDDAGLQIQTKTTPSLIVTVYSPEGKFDNEYLSNYAQKELREQLSRIPGISELIVAGTNQQVLVKQHPGIALLLSPAIDAKPAEVVEAMQKRLGELRAELPPGLLLTFPINAARAEADETNLVLELQLPDGTDDQRKHEALKLLSAKLLEIRGLKNLVGFARNPLESEGNNPCIIVSLAANDAQDSGQRAAIQQLCDSNPATKARLKNFGKPDAASFRAAVSGPDVKVADDLAGNLVRQLQQSGKLQAELRRIPRTIAPRITIKLDASKLAAFGVNSSEVAASLSETLKQTVKADHARGTLAISGLDARTIMSDQDKLRFKNSAGQEIYLKDVASIESLPAKLIVYRVNNQPAVLLVAQSLGEQSAKEVRELVKSQFTSARDTLMVGEEYRLTWLED